MLFEAVWSLHSFGTESGLAIARWHKSISVHFIDLCIAGRLGALCLAAGLADSVLSSGFFVILHL